MYLKFIQRPYIERLGAAYALNLICAFYVARVVRRREPGWPRLLLAIPVIIANSSVALLFVDDAEVISKALFLLCSFWISNFKLLALCLNRGSLTRSWTFAQFAALYMVPIVPRDQLSGLAHSMQCC